MINSVLRSDKHHLYRDLSVQHLDTISEGQTMYGLFKCNLLLNCKHWLRVANNVQEEGGGVVDLGVFI